MSSVSTDRKPLVDYGVQIRFINDLHDTGGGHVEKSKANITAAPSSKYGVAVRVQGISGQPYVVLKDGEKGDSYGVQLNTPAPHSSPTSPYNSLPKRRNSADVSNPYGTVVMTSPSPVSATEDEDGEIFSSPLRRPPGDGQAGTQGEEKETVERSKSQTNLKAKVAEAGKSKLSNEEYNEAGLKPVKLNSAAPLGRQGERKLSSKSRSESFPDPFSTQSESVPAIDTNSLAPINKLISKFNSGTPGAQQVRGRSGARQRLRFDDRRRSRSLDARKEPPVEVPPPSPTINPYAPTESILSRSPVPFSASLGRNNPPVVKVTAREAAKVSTKSPVTLATTETNPPTTKKPSVPHRSQSIEMLTTEEAHFKQAVYNILKDGGETEADLKRKVNLLFETSCRLKKAGSVASHKKEKPEETEDELSRHRDQLLQAHNEITEERMAREAAESRLRLQEDQLAELQEELRRVSDMPHSDSLHTEVLTLQADLAEAAMLRQRQEETLHQRERELTALKGALKEEVECHDKEMETLREQYRLDMEKLRRTMEQVTQSQEQIEEERERVNASIFTLEEELESYRNQEEDWKTQLQETSQELSSTMEKNRKRLSTQTLQKSNEEKLKCEGELKNLKDDVKRLKSEDQSQLAEELQRCMDDLDQARADLDRLKSELDEKSEELEALKKSSGEREAELESQIDRLKTQMQKDKAELQEDLKRAKEQTTATSSVGKTVVDLGSNVELQEANNRLRERLARMRNHSTASKGPETEEAVEALEDENRSLKNQLEEAKRGVTRMSKEREELTRRLEERDLEREALRRGKNDLEEQKRLLDRALEKISKEMEMMMGDSRQSVSTLQTQLDEYRERSRKDLLEAQRNNKDRVAELQRTQSSLKSQQEEVSRLKKELLTCSEERDSAQLERDLLGNRLKHLEDELETEKSTHTDRSREVRCLEDKIKTLEIELDEERSGAELLNDRISRSRDQVDQLRTELMQERSARHDLEMDKSAMERQVKELKSRVADMEGQPRHSPGMALLEVKIQELEERLRSEEREKASIQGAQRRTERRLKELNAILDQERSQHSEQRDQLSLRVKALKRQVDESESEVERLEGVRRKVLRDLEEQQELQEALQAKVSALETELKRKVQQSHRTALSSSALSSEDEGSVYDAFLNDSHLQTSNC
ncbi:cingulin isoform X3 [Synchiropus splendidus]|uniref:cingulin isoform X3 n=1 Tax=Synchiropus splendidus TaxID=270530 RepID=UPI00237D49F7|nr:cingulin isoform X3 [Synchiropus splendidus]